MRLLGNTRDGEYRCCEVGGSKCRKLPAGGLKVCRKDGAKENVIRPFIDTRVYVRAPVTQVLKITPVQTNDMYDNNTATLDHGGQNFYLEWAHMLLLYAGLRE